MFSTFVICISSLDDDVITLVPTIKRCQNLLIQVHNRVPKCDVTKIIFLEYFNFGSVF